MGHYPGLYIGESNVITRVLKSERLGRNMVEAGLRAEVQVGKLRSVLTC